MKTFNPKHLKPEQLAQLYAQALPQAEAAVASAWINLTLNPKDAGAVANYKLTAGRLAALEADLARLVPVPAAPATPKA